MEILALGALEVRDHGGRLGPADLGGRKPKQVLELLVAADGKPAPKEQLIDRLWGEQPPRHPVPTLENHVWVLRRHLASVASEPVVMAEAGAYRLAAKRVSLDLERFDALLHDTHSKSPSRSRAQLEQALGLVRGDVFEDEPYAEWALSLRETYRTKVRDARLQLAELALAASDLGTALEQAGVVVEEDALSERASRVLMHAHDQRGDRDRAVAVFDALRRRLWTELGVEPLPETVAVHAEVRRGGPRGALRTRQRIVPARHPVGGRSSEAAPREKQVPLLGRRGEVATLVGHLQRGLTEVAPAVVFVEGLADVGKTRVVEEACERLADVASCWAQFTAASQRIPGLVLGRAVGPSDGRGAAGALPLTAEALCEAVERRAPVVVVVDDAHHAGASATEMLAYLQLRLDGVPVVIVIVCRREQVGVDHPLRALPRHGHLPIEPLGAEVLGTDGERVLARTGGYGRYVAAWYRGARDGPPSAELLDAVLARCRAAGSRAYRVALAAAALDGSVSPASLAAMTGLRVHHVAEDLERLSARGLLRELAPDRFVFDGTLVAEVLRSQLSRTRRELLRSMLADGSVSSGWATGSLG
jgi:SARP family transcriptional regulator, regulator of embCAB operon